MEARNNAQEINAPKDKVEQEASARNQFTILPLKVVGEKEGEVEADQDI